MELFLPGFAAGFLAAALLFIMFILPINEDPGYGRRWECGKTQVVKVEQFTGHVKGRACKSVPK